MGGPAGRKKTGGKRSRFCHLFGRTWKRRELIGAGGWGSWVGGRPVVQGWVSWWGRRKFVDIFGGPW